MAIRLGVPAMLLAVPAAASHGRSPDWRLFGITNLGGQDVEVFFSATEQRRNAAGNIEVRTVALPLAKFEGVKLDEAHSNHLASKYNRKYVSPMLLARPLVRGARYTQDQVVGAILSEEIADSGAIDPVQRLLLELNCDAKTVKTLSVWTELKGNEGSSQAVAEWEHASPETPLAALLGALCPAT